MKENLKTLIQALLTIVIVPPAFVATLILVIEYCKLLV